MSETATVEAGEATGPAVVILSGLSGGGKTAASKLFEDLGYVVVDNLPAELLTDLADVVAADPERYARVAIVLDIRSGDTALGLAGHGSAARDFEVPPFATPRSGADGALLVNEGKALRERGREASDLGGDAIEAARKLEESERLRREAEELRERSR